MKEQFEEVRQLVMQGQKKQALTLLGRLQKKTS